MIRLKQRQQQQQQQQHVLLLKLFLLFIFAIICNEKNVVAMDATATTTTTTTETKTTSCCNSCCCCPKKLPLKVFILVGQSNMQGHGHVDELWTDPSTKEQLQKNGTLEWLVQNDPDEYGFLKKPQQQQLNKNDNDISTEDWTERTDVWIAYNRQGINNVRPEIKQYGNLRPGFGGENVQNHMGPELGFGWTIAQGLNGDEYTKNNDNDDDCNCNCNDDSSPDSPSSTTTTTTSTCTSTPDDQKQQILLLKIAWGGKSLAVDFRPPSSGNTTGLFYTSMLANIYKTLSHLQEYFPEYNNVKTNGSYELAGFLWHQGWNDGCSKEMTDEYEYNMANFIRDIRTDLNTPNLPVCIAVSGMMGYDNQDAKRLEIIRAQFAMEKDAATKYPDFVNTVKVVETRDFARKPDPASPNKQIYHWYSNCESYWLIGKAMGNAMLGMIQNKQKQESQQNGNDDNDNADVDNLALKDDNINNNVKESVGMASA